MQELPSHSARISAQSVLSPKQHEPQHFLDHRRSDQEQLHESRLACVRRND